MFGKRTRKCAIISLHNTLITIISLSLFIIVSSLFTEVGDIVGVADSTIRQSYRLLYPSRDKLFPDDFKFVTPIDQLPKH